MEEIKGRETADPRLAGVRLAFAPSKAQESLLIDCWPVFAWNKRSGLGECSGEMWALEGPSNSDMKNLLAFPSEKACLRTWRVNLSFFQQTVACKEDKTRSCYGLRYGPGLFKCFSSAGLVVGRGCPLGKPTTK